MPAQIVEHAGVELLEDSLNGVLAAKAARTICVAVPSPSDRGDPRFAIADRVLGSLEQLDARMLDDLRRH